MRIVKVGQRWYYPREKQIVEILSVFPQLDSLDSDYIHFRGMIVQQTLDLNYPVGTIVIWMMPIYDDTEIEFPLNGQDAPE